jgi:hypothetical protein
MTTHATFEKMKASKYPNPLVVQRGNFSFVAIISYKNCVQNLSENLKKGQLGRLKRRWENNIKMDIESVWV